MNCEKRTDLQWVPSRSAERGRKVVHTTGLLDAISVCNHLVRPASLYSAKLWLPESSSRLGQPFQPSEYQSVIDGKVVRH